MPGSTERGRKTYCRGKEMYYINSLITHNEINKSLMNA
jgi:hypothetical protein